jgi:glycosyltransferase involved in cell wall biosynthesis
MSRIAPATTHFNAESLPIISAIRDLIKKHELDVFEMEESCGWSFAVSRLKLLPVVVRLHGPWFLNGKFNDPNEKSAQNRGRERRECRGIQDAQFVTAPSAEVLRAVKKYYHVKLTASKVVANPLEADVMARIWNVETCDKERLLFVGRFDRRKGGDLILHVFAQLAASYPKLRLTFVGPNRGIISADGDTRFLEDYVRNNFPECCRSRIDFCGEMAYSEIMPLRQKHFATIVASQYEIMPYVVLEAMSAGCPLVATSVGGIPEMVQDERNGLLVPSQDVNAMTAACKRLLDDHSLAARLGRQAWLDCREFYRPDNIAKQTIEAYKEAIKQFGFG